MLRFAFIALIFLSVSASAQTCATLAECRAENAKLKDDASKLADYAKALKAAYQQAVDDNDRLANKYNYLLAEARQQLRDADEKMARMNRDLNYSNQRANALALFSLMPRYEPIQVVPLPQNNSFHCISNNVGTTTYTDCH